MARRRDAAGIGTVLRCPDCDAVLMRLVHAHGEVRMEMRGVRVMRFTGSASG